MWLLSISGLNGGNRGEEKELIEVDGKTLMTETQWAKKYRAVLKRQLKKGEVRRWFTPEGRRAVAVFYCEDQTRPYNKRELQRARKKRREMEKTRKARLSCRCCGEYFGRYAKYELVAGLCSFCAKPHTAWQWLAYKHIAPKLNAVPEGKHPVHWDPVMEDWIESEKEWYYYTASQVKLVDDKRFEKLKELYIKTYGGWETIDLDNTTYDGHKWW